MYSEDDLLALSALQHVLFCERQFAFIHVEGGWRENQFTAEGRLLHERAHSPHVEQRPGVRLETAVPIRSLELGVSGVADVVEIHSDGVRYPVEYKRGSRKAKLMDEVQLCAQALCVEEMLGIDVPEGALFYGKERRRKVVAFGGALRDLTRRAAARAHAIAGSGTTPPPIYKRECRSCSFYEPCMPRFLSQRRDVYHYLKNMAEAPIGADSEEEGNP